MISVVSIFNDVAFDDINRDENGDLNFDMFNRLSRRAELRLLDYLTGDVEDQKPPAPYLTQKNRDWIAHLIVTLKANVNEGKLILPDNYYAWENHYIMKKAECENENHIHNNCGVPIEILNSSKFTYRCNTYIRSKKPSLQRPIARLVGNEVKEKEGDKRLEYAPVDLGSVMLEYVRLPQFAQVVSKMDTVYNNQVPDEVKSKNYEWPEAVRDLLIFFITQGFGRHTREDAIQQQNAVIGKSVRG